MSAAAGASSSLGIVFGIDRFVAFTGMVLLVGGAGFLLTLWPAGFDDRRARRLVAGGWVAVFLATAAGIALQAAYAQGGTLADAFDPRPRRRRAERPRGPHLARPPGRCSLVVAVAARVITRPLTTARPAGDGDADGDEGPRARRRRRRPGCPTS